MIKGLWWWPKHKQMLVTDSATGEVFVCDGVEIKNPRKLTDDWKVQRFRRFQAMGEIKPVGSLVLIAENMEERREEQSCQLEAKTEVH